MGGEAAPKRATPVVPDIPYLPVLLPVPGRSRASGRRLVRSYILSMEIPASARRAWEFQEVTTATMGCEAAPKWATSVVPDVPRAPFMLPVPGRSRTSPLLHLRDRRQAGVARPV
ncbi:hypothetical protein CU665_19145 [Pseudomonas syringae pv. actinidifoliorum]|nr:hypothetical protein [Pseudomonas syringae pv. actinidifoliorum]